MACCVCWNFSVWFSNFKLGSSLLYFPMFFTIHLLAYWRPTRSITCCFFYPFKSKLNWGAEHKLCMQGPQGGCKASCGSQSTITNDPQALSYSQPPTPPQKNPERSQTPKNLKNQYWERLYGDRALALPLADQVWPQALSGVAQSLPQTKTPTFLFSWHFYFPSL